jgi:flagellar FliL protein
MAKKTTDDEGNEVPQKKKSNKMLFIIIGVLVLAAAAYFLVLKPKAEPAAAPGAAGPEAAAAAAMAAAAALPEGPVVRLDPIFINLAEGHYLKLGMGLQTMGPQNEKEPMDGALALDAAIQIYSNQDMASLTNEDMRKELKEKLVAMVTKGYNFKVSEVYITEFVMQ